MVHDTRAAQLLRFLGIGAESAEANQLRRLLEAKPELSTLTDLRDYLGGQRSAEHCTAELDAVATRLSIRSLHDPDKDFHPNAPSGLLITHQPPNRPS